MIINKVQDLMMKQKIRLYNNFAHIDECMGRLEVDLRVFPSPRIVWNFETLGENACLPPLPMGSGRIVGSEFFIDTPIHTGIHSSGKVSLQRQLAVKGLAGRASFGDTSQNFSFFEFLLPNARFQERNFMGQQLLEKQIRIRGYEKEAFRSGGILRKLTDFLSQVMQKLTKRVLRLGLRGKETSKRNSSRKHEEFQLGESEGRRIVASLNERWFISLETRQNALNWLDPQSDNVGTLLTTRGTFEQRKDRGEKITVPLLEVEQQIQNLCKLLSFANGGYVGPLYIEGYHYSEEHLFAATCPISRVTPLELLGRSWLTLQSDFAGYIGCIPTLNKMLDSTWRETFDLILAWYFQAIQPESLQVRRKPWPVIANAIGAALESLKATLLVRELGAERTGGNQGTDYLLKRMGITSDRGFDDLDYVEDFWDIRNAATHKMAKTTFSDEERSKILNRATQWIEEMLLWRLGYHGEYCDRLSGNSTKPRYDLTVREPSWGKVL